MKSAVLISEIGNSFFFYLLALQLVVCRVAALKSSTVHRPYCSILPYVFFGFHCQFIQSH